MAKSSVELAEGAVEAVAVDAHEAAAEVLAGRPRAAARRWLGWVSLAAFAGFVADTVAVLSGTPVNGLDLRVALAVQRTPWGPLVPLMTLTNWLSGIRQVILGVVVIAALAIVERRAGWLMLLGAGASLIDQLLKTSVGRHRPTPDVLAVLDPSNGYSFPSGHAVFFTWLAFMVAVSLAPRLRGWRRTALWCGAGLLVTIVCLGRVWAGAHWPSDVLGGLLLSLSWSAFVLWLPERWLPAPRLRRRHR